MHQGSTYVRKWQYCVVSSSKWGKKIKEKYLRIPLVQEILQNNRFFFSEYITKQNVH